MWIRPLHVPFQKQFIKSQEFQFMVDLVMTQVRIVNFDVEGNLIAGKYKVEAF